MDWGVSLFPCFAEIVAGVPDLGRYLTLGELEHSTDLLAAAHPEIEVWSPGASRAGRPLRCLEIPGGPLQALLVGLPHPEEPVGTLALEYLLPLLADGLATELGFNFSVIKAGDPDATLLNEPWFDEPYDLTGFLLRVYRPPLHDQFEWTFPMSYKRYAFTRPLPEAAAVMKVIGRRPLDFYMPMHNSTFSGAYYYLSEEDAQLQDELTAVMAAAGLPPDCGEPEMPYLRQLAPGIFRGFGLAEDYEFYEAYGADPAVVLDFGTSSDDYAEAMWDCFTLVSEVPYFTSPRIADQAQPGSPVARPSSVASRSRSSWRCGCTSATWRQPPASQPRRRGSARCTPISPRSKTISAPRASRPRPSRSSRRRRPWPSSSTRCTCGSSTRWPGVGQFAGMVAAEAQQDDVLRALHDEAVLEVRTRAERLAAAGGIEATPIRALVQCQVASLLCALVATRDRYRPARPRPVEPRTAR